MPLLNEPIRLGDRMIRNRIVMPPMVLAKKSADAWRPDAEHLEYYARRARAGTGLIIVEATAVAPDGRLAPFQLCAWDDDHHPHLASLAGAIKKNGATAMIQIHHAGANTLRSYLDGAVPLSPSGIPVRGRPGNKVPPRVLNEDEIEGIIAAFAAAARRCIQAGFDGVELHGAHGYLLSQFLSPAFNRRTDAWGGVRGGGSFAIHHSIQS